MSERPTSNGDQAAWKAYWTAQGMPWRTEPEIDEERQQYLAERRAVKPDIERGIYPFRDETGNIKLNRADIEWLLGTHESGGMVGPVQWDEENYKPEHLRRQGVDLRGADLQRVDLRGMPLARLDARGANLFGAQLEGASLNQAHLEGANLRTSSLDRYTRLYDIWFGDQRRDIYSRVRNSGGVALAVVLLGVIAAYLAPIVAGIFVAVLSAWLVRKTGLGLPGLSEQLNRAEPTFGIVLGATIFVAVTIIVRLIYVLTIRPGTSIRGALLADIYWSDAELYDVDWLRISILGDESLAKAKDKATSIFVNWGGHGDEEYGNAARAYLQLAHALRNRGLNGQADYYSYRAQVMHRHVLLRQYKVGPWLGSWFLWLISGYGYRPSRSVFTYLLVVLGFAAAFFFLTPITGVHFEPLGALVFSVTSFHGRGFSPGEAVPLTNLVTVLAAGEAIIGLLIEITFIATFTQRFFAR